MPTIDEWVNKKNKDGEVLVFKRVKLFPTPGYENVKAIGQLDILPGASPIHLVEDFSYLVSKKCYPSSYVSLPAESYFLKDQTLLNLKELNVPIESVQIGVEKINFFYNEENYTAAMNKFQETDGVRN